MPRIPVPLPAESVSVYDALADVDAYAQIRGDTAWGGAGQESKRVASVRAAAWMNSLPWQGRRAAKDQKDAWGREGVMDADGYSWETDELPPSVRDAYCEMCFVFLAVGRDEMPDPTAPLSERDRETTSESIDVLSFRYGEKFALPLIQDPLTGFPVVDGLLAGFLRSNGKYGCVEVGRG